MNPSPLSLSPQSNPILSQPSPLSAEWSPGQFESNDYAYAQDGDAKLGGDVGSQAAVNGSATGRGTSATPSAPKIRRRNRMITSCLECRRRKLKCDRLHPCTNCAKSNRDCLFLAPALDADSKRKLTEIKDKMGSLERALEQDAADRKSPHQDGIKVESEDRFPSNELFEEPSEAQGAVPEDERNLKPTPMAVQDAAYEDGSDDDTADLGFKLGKLRMTDRIGGFYRPKIADELTLALNDLILSEKPTDASKPRTPSLRELMPEVKDADFNPGPSYIAPRSDVFFGGGQKMYSLADFLPSRAAADRLLQQYWEAVDPVAKIVHRPTFEKQYNDFWLDISRGFEPAYSLQALIFAALFTAVLSMPEDSILNLFGSTQKKLTENFQSATEMALGKAKFLKTSKTQTLQALVMYMIPMCRAEVSRAHSVLAGTAIRLAECMGFHRDPDEYGLGPIETHVRRMIWYQLCFLDIRTSETQGPRQTIRREDFSTKFPLNIDDNDLGATSLVPLTNKNQWTDMTFMRIRFECHELQRLINVDKVRLEKKGVSLTRVLGKIEVFRKATMDKYGPLMHVPNPKPIQRAAQLVLSVLLNRTYISVLHRYHNSVRIQIPDRLRQIIITSGTKMMEDAIELETNPAFKQWAWYAGAINLWHTAFLMLVEVFQFPMRKEADRIWQCLDYVFETPTSPFEPGGERFSEGNRREIIAHRDQKARHILRQLRDRMLLYREKRKMKVPVSMQETQVAGDIDATRNNLQRQAEGKLPETVKLATQDSGFPTPIAPAPTVPQITSVPATLADQQPLPPPLIVYPPQNEPYQQSNIQNPPPDMSQWPQQQQQTPQPTTAPPQPQLTPTLSQPTQLEPYQPFNYGPLHTLQNPQHDNIPRGQSVESETTSDDSGTSGLWFYPGVGSGTAGVAPTPPVLIPVGGNQISYKDPTSGDMPMLDIDWNEWDKIFPPDINTGDLNLPQATTSAPLASSLTCLPSEQGLGDPSYPSYPYGSPYPASTAPQQFPP